ncbi:MAG: hypothetical protein WA152_02530 [Microgenomates group bacterium]
MTIEWIPPTLATIPERNLENREADVTCNQCGVLGGGTVSAIDGRKLAKEHNHDHSDHKVKVIEVSCFM